ncbi:hypothetical protein FA15DRAFT_675668, partial [Coprinopsis marcescibilis]
MSYPVVYIGLLLACAFAAPSGFQQVMGPASPNISSLSLANLIAYVLANTLWEIFDLNERLEPFISFMRNLVNDGVQPLQPSHANHPQRQEQGLQWRHRPECATLGCRQSGCSVA